MPDSTEPTQEQATEVRLPAHINSRSLKLLASMVAQSVSQFEIMDALSLTEDEYDFIVAHPNVIREVRKAKTIVAEQKHTTATDWDDIEALALQQVKAKIGNVDDARDALSIAAAANKADRRRVDSNKNPRGTPLAAHAGGVRLPSAEHREAVYEKLTLREARVLEEAPQHVAAVTSVEAVEQFMERQIGVAVEVKQDKEPS